MFNLIQNIQITQSYYVKLKFGYIKNSTQNFNKDLNGPFLTHIQNVFYYVCMYICTFPQCIEFGSIGSLSPNDCVDQSSPREGENETYCITRTWCVKELNVLGLTNCALRQVESVYSRIAIPVFPTRGRRNLRSSAEGRVD